MEDRRNPSTIPVAKATSDPLERELYAHDVAAVPALLSRALFRATPDVVARPLTTQEVSALLKYASEHRLPVTPRATGSTAFHNAVPARGGVLLDLNALRGIVEVDSGRLTATVLAATRWKELDDELRYRWALAIKSYPTSAPSATVGGWFNMGGRGIGTLKYGCFHDQVSRAEVVLSSGEAMTLMKDSQPPLSWFAGSEGTLGVVTQLELSLRPDPEAERHCLAGFSDVVSLQGAALALAASQPKPYHLHLADATFFALLRRAGFKTPVSEGWTLTIHYQGRREEVEAGAVQAAALVQSYSGDIHPEEESREEWGQRFAEVRIKRAGPSLLGAEVRLPLQRLAQFAAAVGRLSRRHHLPICLYGSIASSELCQVNAFFAADERDAFRYLVSLGLVGKLHQAAGKLGGSPYGIGAWNMPYLGYAYTRRELAEIRRRKQMLDPHGIMNPGKVYGPPALLAQPGFSLATDVLAFMHWLFAQKGG